MKEVMLEVALESTINEVIAETADHGNTDTVAMWEHRDAVRGSSEGQPLVTDEGNSCDKKDDNVPEEVRLTKKENLTLKGLSDIFHSIERIRDKMLEVDPNSEWSMAICQGPEKILFIVSYMMRRKRQALFKSLLIKFLQIKTFQFLRFLIF